MAERVPSAGSPGGVAFAALVREAFRGPAAAVEAVLGGGARLEVRESAVAAAGGLLERVGATVVAFERPVGAAAGGALFGLVSEGDAARLAGRAVGEAEPPAYDADRHGQALARVLDAIVQTALEPLKLRVSVVAEGPPAFPKVFALAQDLNRATAFLGEGELSAVRLAIRVGEGGEAAAWLVARPALAAALAAARQAASAPADLQHLLGISVPVIVVVAEKKMALQEVLSLGVGKVLEFDKPSEEFLDLLANNRLIGRGEAVRVGDRFGLRLVEIGDVKETIRRLGQPPGSGRSPA